MSQVTSEKSENLTEAEKTREATEENFKLLFSIYMVD